MVSINVNNTPISMQLDSGSDVTIIAKSTWHKLGKPKIESTDINGVAANGTTINFLGKMQCNVQLDNVKFNGNVFISNCKQNFLGRNWMHELGINMVSNKLSKPLMHYYQPVTASVIISNSAAIFCKNLPTEFPSVFNAKFGLCTKVKASFQLNVNAKPVFRSKRPLPFGSIEAVNLELDRLEQEGIITPIDHSLWAAPLVTVKKANGTMRMCVDFSTGLNDALMLHQHPLPHPDNLFATLNGGRFFSKLDLADAYLQVELDEQSKQLAVINTHRGLYKYNRLPFGIKSAPGIFQQIMDTMLAGIPQTIAYLDDIIIVSKTEAEHMHALKKVFQRIQSYGFKVQMSKCQFFMTNIKYLGQIVTQEGRRPDPKKVSAIIAMPAPVNIHQVRSFLGMLNYYGQFVKTMRQLRVPLDKLLKKDVEFQWSNDCQNAFDEAKQILQSDLLLTHYNLDLPIFVAADASKDGIGAVIAHHFPNGAVKAIMHASSSFSTTECNYSQIEKEALALIFVVKKFHRMIYGRPFTLQTDHKPLLAIFGSKKGIPVYTANRLQRWALTLLAYDFKIEYIKTTNFGQADTLSRLIASQPNIQEDRIIANIRIDTATGTARSFNDSISTLPITAEIIRKETESDEILQIVAQAIQSSWPSNITPQIQLFHNHRNALSIFNGCIMLNASSFLHHFANQFYAHCT